MKRLKIGLLAAGAVLLSGFGSMVAAQPAIEETANERGVATQVVKKGATHEGALYTAAGILKVEGTVNGSVYCAAGSEVEITGTVNGDVLCAGSKVHISGTITQDVRLAGVSVVIDGKIGGDATIAALEQVKIGTGAKVAGELQLHGGDVELNGEIGKNTHLWVTKLQVGESAKFMGDVQYSAEQEYAFDRERVQGGVLYHQPGQEEDPLVAIITMAVMLLVLAMLTAIIAPRFVERSSVIARENIGLAILAGVAVVFITPVVAILTLLTIVGMPIAIILIALYIALLSMSGAFFAYFLGSLLFKQSKNILVRMLAGVVFLAALLIIPVINIVAFIATIIMGSGIAVRTLTHNYKAPRYSLHPPVATPPLPGVLAENTTDSSKTVKRVKSTTKDKSTTSDAEQDTK